MAAATRPAGPGDAVDGRAAATVAEPATVAEAAELLREATADGHRVVCRGGGTKLGWGNPPAAVDLILSTARLNRVLEHARGDLTVSVEAGVRLAGLQETLAPAGQFLAVDPPEPGATAGGVIAANASGPRRLRYGTVRDLLIGVTVVLADGTVAHSGGKVVKNVAGYDLGKLFTGSLGTLGLIAEATFRLHPRQPASRVVRLEVDQPAQAGAAVLELLGCQLVPSALELAWPSQAEPGTLLVLFEGIEPSAQGQAEAAVRLLGGTGAARVLDQEEAAGALATLGALPWQLAWWTGDGGVELPDDEVGVKLACVPGELAGAVEDLRAAAERQRLRLAIAGRAASTVLHAALRRGDAAALAAAVQDARERLAGRGGSLVVLAAPPEVKRHLDVWGPIHGGTLALARHVKQRFDPNGTMSPGRFVGGI